MKIIDLLNKIANGEEVPDKIRFEGNVFEKQDETNFYCTSFGIFEEAFVLEDLNKEVEIIEEDKKIEKLPYYSLKKIQKAENKEEHYKRRIELLEKRVEDYHNKINELINKVNSLEKNK